MYTPIHIINLFFFSSIHDVKHVTYFKLAFEEFMISILIIDEICVKDEKYLLEGNS